MHVALLPLLLVLPALALSDCLNLTGSAPANIATLTYLVFHVSTL
jgi:hypothetical protein